MNQRKNHELKIFLLPAPAEVGHQVPVVHAVRSPGHRVVFFIPEHEQKRSLGFLIKYLIFIKGGFFHYFIHHCFICHPSEPTVSVDAGIEPPTVATTALAVRRS